MWKIVWKHGLVAGAIMGAVMFGGLPFREQIGFGALGMIIGYTTMVLAFLMIYVGVRSYRDTVAQGSVGFGQALGVGLLIALVGTAIYVACWEVIFFFITPEYMDAAGQAAVEQARAAGQSEAEVAKLADDMRAFAESYKNPLVNIAYTFLEPLPVGLLFSLVSAWLVSRKSRPVTGALAA